MDQDKNKALHGANTFSLFKVIFIGWINYLTTEPQHPAFYCHFLSPLEAVKEMFGKCLFLFLLFLPALQT